MVVEFHERRMAIHIAIDLPLLASSAQEQDRAMYAPAPRFAFARHDARVGKGRRSRTAPSSRRISNRNIALCFLLFQAGYGGGSCGAAGAKEKVIHALRARELIYALEELLRDGTRQCSPIPALAAIQALGGAPHERRSGAATRMMLAPSS